jgi:hypothetical protein
MWERHCRAALASLDFFDSVFYQEKIECPAGEAKDKLKYQILIFSTKTTLKSNFKNKYD